LSTLSTLSTLSSSCDVDPELARKGWLQDTLVRDNQIFLERDPELAGGKLAKMGAAPYDYFRGSASQFGRDFTQAGSPGYWPTRYLDDEGWDVALVGDPHPENIGTFIATDGVVRVEFNDFDGATWGPWISDLRRLALGFDVACRQLRQRQADDAVNVLVEDDCVAWPRAVVEGYLAELPLVAADPDDPQRLRLREGQSHGLVVDDLLEKAREDGDAGSRLEDYTVVENGERRMVYGQIEPGSVARFGDREIALYGDTLVELGDDERQLVEALLDTYPLSLSEAVPVAELELIGVARRLGSGVSSYPVPRYYLLLAGPSDAPDDDFMLEAKQILDPLLLPGAPRQPRPGWPDNVTRVIEMQRLLQDDGADRWLGGAMLGDLALKVRHRSGYTRGFSVDRALEKLGEGDWVAADLLLFAEQAGRLLAVAHGRAPKGDGQRGGPAIARAIEADPQGLVDETVDFIAVYGPRTALDHGLLGELIEEHGPSLGYRRQGDGQ
ncbi:MAG: DUF2252 family protein, partial [Myxococcales bacterium]|nr:DUF2252 family protein [Myxococcales bacterium]